MPDPGQEAKPIDDHPLFPDLPYTAHTRKSLGKSVGLELYILSNTEVQTANIIKGEGSGDADYDELVKENAPKHFQPNFQGGKPADGFRDITVRLDPIK